MRHKKNYENNHKCAPTMNDEYDLINLENNHKTFEFYKYYSIKFMSTLKGQFILIYVYVKNQNFCQYLN